MTAELRGFPDRFPVRDDDVRSLRYRAASFLGRLYVRTFFRQGFEVRGAANIPQNGPLLIVCNHLSNIDPLLFGGFFPHTLFAMAKRELYSLPPAAWWLAGCNCIPVNRGGADRRAVTRALGVLQRNGRLLLFIEGTRSPTATMQRAEAGAGFLARRSGASVQPVAIWGTERAGKVRLPRSRVRITMSYGRPFQPDVEGRRDDGAIAEEMAAAVAALLPPEYRGVYAEPVRTPVGAAARRSAPA